MSTTRKRAQSIPSDQPFKTIRLHPYTLNELPIDAAELILSFLSRRDMSSSFSVNRRTYHYLKRQPTAPQCWPRFIRTVHNWQCVLWKLCELGTVPLMEEFLDSWHCTWYGRSKVVGHMTRLLTSSGFASVLDAGMCSMPYRDSTSLYHVLPSVPIVAWVELGFWSAAWEAFRFSGSIPSVELMHHLNWHLSLCRASRRSRRDPHRHVEDMIPVKAARRFFENWRLVNYSPEVDLNRLAKRMYDVGERCELWINTGFVCEEPALSMVDLVYHALYVGESDRSAELMTKVRVFSADMTRWLPAHDNSELYTPRPLTREILTSRLIPAFQSIRARVNIDPLTMLNAMQTKHVDPRALIVMWLHAIDRTEVLTLTGRRCTRTSCESSAVLQSAVSGSLVLKYMREQVRTPTEVNLVMRAWSKWALVGMATNLISVLDLVSVLPPKLPLTDTDGHESMKWPLARAITVLGLKPVWSRLPECNPTWKTARQQLLLELERRYHLACLHGLEFILSSITPHPVYGDVNAMCRGMLVLSEVSDQCKREWPVICRLLKDGHYAEQYHHGVDNISERLRRLPAVDFFILARVLRRRMGAVFNVDVVGMHEACLRRRGALSSLVDLVRGALEQISYRTKAGRHVISRLSNVGVRCESIYCEFPMFTWTHIIGTGAFFMHAFNHDAPIYWPREARLISIHSIDNLTKLWMSLAAGDQSTNTTYVNEANLSTATGQTSIRGLVAAEHWDTLALVLEHCPSVLSEGMKACIESHMSYLSRLSFTWEEETLTNPELVEPATLHFSPPTGGTASSPLSL